MKAIIRSMSIAVAALMIAAVPTLAEEGVWGQQQQQLEKEWLQNQKDQCLVVAKNCAADSMQQRVDRLKKEIAKGSAVYTEEELRGLNDQLNWIKNESENQFNDM